MRHIMMDMNEHQDQRYTWGDNNGCDLYLLGVNVLVKLHPVKLDCDSITTRVPGWVGGWVGPHRTFFAYKS